MRKPDSQSYWNTNVARHAGILRAVPAGCGEALDVGCGDGLLALKLGARSRHVTGIDMCPDMIARARESATGRPGLSFVEGDFLTTELPAEGYDFICSVTTLHHLDFGSALTRMRELLRPGGALVVVGLALDEGVADWTFRIVTQPAVRIAKSLRGARTPEGMPVAEAHMNYAQVRAEARRLLPGVRYRRHVLRRYSLTWEKPLTA